MAFITNAENFTLGDGVYNNVHGDLVHHVHNHFYGIQDYGGLIEGSHGLQREEGDRESVAGTAIEASRQRREDEEEDEVEIIRRKHIKFVSEIGCGPGYLLHAGLHEGRAVIIKVFNPSPDVGERRAATVALSRMLVHSNVLRIEGISPPKSVDHFIVYEGVYSKSAEGPLADALKDGVPESVALGFHMVAGLSAGINYLGIQGISMRTMGVENFDIFLDIGDRFMISINPSSSTRDKAVHAGEQEDDWGWGIFNALCKKVLRSANDRLHTEKIERDPATLDAWLPSNASVRASGSSPVAESATSQDTNEEIPPIPPRREYVWRTIDRGQLSLASVASQIRSYLELLSPLNRLVGTEAPSPHRCAGYLREEITLATTTIASAVVSHDAPSPLEICPVCNEVVRLQEVLECVCGDSVVGARHTIKCGQCKRWSHSDCVDPGKLKDFTCHLCAPSPGPSPAASHSAKQPQKIVARKRAPSGSKDGQPLSIVTAFSPDPGRQVPSWRTWQRSVFV
ncbi:hypothetical protein DFH06DRAFT_274380 [Mycena polygramma]|nr:hypothetical protein DFH06DRAFT_274380 [Mycena polygramma]